jgi:hypothetical protein
LLRRDVEEQGGAPGQRSYTAGVVCDGAGRRAVALGKRMSIGEMLALGALALVPALAVLLGLRGKQRPRPPRRDDDMEPW